MKRYAFVVATFATMAALAGEAVAVPGTVTLTARISDADGPVDGSVDLSFQIFNAATAGTMMWEETHDGVTADEGLVFVNLGSEDALDASVFTGGAMFLQISVNGAAQSPRLAINSTPYAVRASVADSALTLGTLDPGDVALSAHNHDSAYAAAGHNHDAAYAGLAHTHAAGDISAYTDLGAEGYLDNNAGTDLLRQSDGDGRYSLTGHTHAGGGAVIMGDQTSSIASAVAGTNYIMPGSNAFTAANAGRCFISVNFYTTGSSESFTGAHVLPAVQTNGTNSFPANHFEYLQRANYSSDMFVASPSTSALTTVAGNTYRFGCYWSVDGTLVGNSGNCMAHYVCTN